MENPSARKSLSDCLRPFSKASTLPAFCYTSPEWHQLELENVFLKEWLCVGREDQIPNPGDYFRFDIAGEPLVIVRDRAGVVHAHSPICRHRSAVVAQGKGNCRAFVCPYHNWTYALSGELLATPGSTDPMEQAVGFSREDFGLVSHRVELWEGFIFVTFDPQRPSLKDWLKDLPAKVRNYKLQELRVDRQFEYTIDCNWKIYYENSSENYHTSTVHYRNLPGSKPEPSQFPAGDGPYSHFFVPKAISALSGFPCIEGLSDDEQKGTSFILVQPNLQFILTPTYVVFRQFIPLGPERVKIVHNWCFPESTIRRDDFAERVDGEYYDRYKPVVQEDVELTPLVQKGLRSRFAKPGRFAKEEVLLHQIAQYLIRKIDGKAGEA